jgi:hypothetical protein
MHAGRLKREKTVKTARHLQTIAFPGKKPFMSARFPFFVSEITVSVQRATRSFCKEAAGIASLVFHAERRVGYRFSLADGASARRLETVPLPEHEPALPAFGRNLRQPAPFGTETFPKVFQVIRDLFFRPPDDGGDFLCRKRTFLQEGADLMPDGLRFLRPLVRRIPVVPHAAAYAAAGRRAAPVAHTVAMFPPLFRSALRKRQFPPDHLML